MARALAQAPEEVLGAVQRNPRGFALLTAAGVLVWNYDALLAATLGMHGLDADGAPVFVPGAATVLAERAVDEAGAMAREGTAAVERALLVGSWVLVMIVELLNSAIEATVDRVGTEHHQLAGRAKDIGSASVFLAISLALLVWALVLLPRYL